MNKLKKIFMVLILVVLVAGCGITKSDDDFKDIEDVDVKIIETLNYDNYIVSYSSNNCQTLVPSSALLQFFPPR